MSQADVVELDNPHIVAVAGGGRVALASYKKALSILLLDGRPGFETDSNQIYSS